MLPCCSGGRAARSSQFGSHEVDVGLGQGKEGKAPLELGHVLDQRRLYTDGQVSVLQTLTHHPKSYIILPILYYRRTLLLYYKRMTTLPVARRGQGPG